MRYCVKPEITQFVFNTINILISIELQETKADNKDFNNIPGFEAFIFKTETRPLSPRWNDYAS